MEKFSDKFDHSDSSINQNSRVEPTVSSRCLYRTGIVASQAVHGRRQELRRSAICQPRASAMGQQPVSRLPCRFTACHALACPRAEALGYHLSPLRGNRPHPHNRSKNSNPFETGVNPFSANQAGLNNLDIYRAPVSQRIVTIFFPRPICFASFTAPQTLMADESPRKNPSACNK